MPWRAALGVRALVRLVLAVFFRRVEVVGAERIPRGVPLIVVANHVNALVDPLLVLGPLDLDPLPRLLAKSTLWKNPFLRPWLVLAGVIPVYRRQDEGDMAGNLGTFARCHDLLAQSGAIALFPEGQSHNEPSLQPLKTGAARIALEAVAKQPGLAVRILPVGLLFDAKEKFRSRALVQVGEPLDPEPETALARQDPVQAVRALTSRIDAALKEVTLNYASWDEARLVARAAELWSRRTLELPAGRTLAETFTLHRAFLDGLADLRERRPERVAEVAEAVRRYDRLLRTFRLRDEQVAADYPVSPVARFVLATLLHLLVHFPLAVVGTVLNWPSYRLVGWIADRVTGKSRGKGGREDQPATYKVFTGVLLFPLTWLAEALLAGRFLGAWAGLGVFLLAPLSGLSALLFHERRVFFQREARAYLVLRTRARLAAELKARRQAVLDGVEELAGCLEERG